MMIICPIKSIILKKNEKSNFPVIFRSQIATYSLEINENVADGIFVLDFQVKHYYFFA